MDEALRPIIGALITSVLIFIAVLLAFTVLRRVIHGMRYARLDAKRHLFHSTITRLIDSGQVFDKLGDLRRHARYEVDRLAMEDVLFRLEADGRYRDAARRLFAELGFVSHYERALRDGSTITRASAIDKLGRMSSTGSTEKLVPMLEADKPEIIGVTIRALSKLGSRGAIRGILERLPRLLEKSLVTEKALAAFLVNFGPKVVGDLIDYLEATESPGTKALLLEVLSQIRSEEAVPVALRHLGDENTEVVVKAMKVIETTAPAVDGFDWDRIAACLSNPSWVVKMHTARALGNKGYEKAIDDLAMLLLDESWHVRNAAAVALAKMGNASLDALLSALSLNDPYVKGSVCEEIQRTGYDGALIDNLRSGDGEVYAKSRDILEMMCIMGFRAPFENYLEQGAEPGVKKQVRDILMEGERA
ncbi:MAG: HEAT repeat domain-containing protein [Nitrospirota bacterium]|jgi:hypothetical protein